MKTKITNIIVPGFTLIEVLIVVAIIGILAAVMTANYREGIERATAAACQQNLKTVFTALSSYRVDYNHYPPADGVADVKPRPDRTAFKCGPAANGYWSGVSLLLVEHGYCPEESLYCPALKRMYDRSIETYPSCSDSEFAGKSVPQWRFLRFAYNNAAADVGGLEGGENNIEKDAEDVWLLRCLHLNIGEFDKDRHIRFPFRVKRDDENAEWTWYGEFEISVQGHIRLRPVELRK